MGLCVGHTREISTERPYIVKHLQGGEVRDGETERSAAPSRPQRPGDHSGRRRLRRGAHGLPRRDRPPPALIVQVADAIDVSRVVGLARDGGLELAVRSGGHSGAGHSTTDGGIVLDLSEMKNLEIDTEGRTA